jgi:NSS family neurotransmitter:Na+ symporter
MERQQWSSEKVFILAAIGSAAGLGNIWRFPYIAYENGGGAFLIPYLVAFLTAGIPLIILETAIGQRLQQGPVGSWKRINKRTEGLGWCSILVTGTILVYYAVIMTWALVYLYYSLSLRWAGNAESFFVNDFLQTSSGPGSLGGVNVAILAGLLASWAIVYLAVRRGTDVLGRLMKVLVPLPVILILIMIVRGVTLDGAAEGLRYYLTPQFGALLKAEGWIAAYSQVFFSVSVGMGILIAYGSYKPKVSDINRSSLIVGTADAAIAFLAGFAVFSILGYLAQASGAGIDEVVSGGFGLAFVAFPTAIELLPVGASLLGILFFFMLFTFALSSVISSVVTLSATFMDARGWSTERSAALVCVPLAGLGVFFTTGAGIHWVQILDTFVFDYGIAVVAFVELILIRYVVDVKDFQRWINSVSSWKVGGWWRACVLYLTPAIMGASLVAGLWGLVVKGGIRSIGTFPAWSTIGTFAFIVIAIPVLAWVVLPRIRTDRDVHDCGKFSRDEDIPDIDTPRIEH